MIFFFNAEGSLIKNIPQNLYQGSNRANRIILVMPTVADSLVNVAFKLPNGEYSTQRLMTNTTSGTGLVTNGNKLVDENGNICYAWYYDIPSAITQYSGKLTIQFFVTDSTKTVIATDSVNVDINKGVPVIQPEDDNSYQTVINNLAELSSRVSGIEIENESFKNEIEQAQKRFESVITEQLDNNTIKVDLLYQIAEQSGQFYVANIEDDFTYRKTADGLKVVDSSPVTVNKISGATVKSKNLFNIDVISTTEGGTIRNGDTLTAYSIYNYAYAEGGGYAYFGKVCPQIKDYIGKYAVLSMDTTSDNKIMALGSGSYAKDIIAGRPFLIDEGALTAIPKFHPNADGTPSTITNIQVEIVDSATSSATEYQPYFLDLKNAYFEKIISTGRNLINIPDQNITITSSDSTSYKNVDLGFRLKSNTTYTISYDYNVQSINGTLTPLVDLFMKDDNEQVVSNTNNRNWTTKLNTLSNGKALCTFTTSIITKGKDRLFVRFVRLESAGDLQATASNIMLNLGDTAFAYEPYTESLLGLTEQQELGFCDYIDTQTGEIVFCAKNVVFNGTENWEQNTANDEIYYSTTLPELASLETTQCICSHYQSNSGEINGSGVFVLNGTDFIIAVETASQFSSVDELKSYLSSEPITVAYKLRTPIVSSVVIEKSYVAYENGTETVVQGTIDNSEYGAKPITEIEYYVLGVKQ